MMTFPNSPRVQSPPKNVIKRMRELISGHFSGTNNIVIEKLFSLSFPPDGSWQTVTTQDLAMAIPNVPKGTLGKAIERLRKELPTFSAESPGMRILGWALSIDERRGFHTLCAKPVEDRKEGRETSNRSQSAPVDFVERFWSEYIESDRPVRIYYPEPLFFRDGKDTYMRNAKAGTEGSKAFFSYLNVQGDLVGDYYFVSAGVVSAMLKLIDFFQGHKVAVKPTPVRTGHAVGHETDDFENVNIVVLGTPTSNEMILSMEGSKPFRFVQEGVTFNSAAPADVRRADNAVLRDIYEDNGKGQIGFGLVTRFKHSRGHYDGVVPSYATVLSAREGRLVNQLAKALIDSGDLKDLAALFGTDLGNEIFPSELQALFEFKLFRDEKNNRVLRHVDGTRPYLATQLGRGAIRRPSSDGN